MKMGIFTSHRPRMTHNRALWPHLPMARHPDSHSGNAGSIPVGATCGCSSRVASETSEGVTRKERIDIRTYISSL